MWQQLVDIPINFWQVLGEMAPYLLFGFFVAGILSVVLSADTIEKHLGGRGIWPILKASALGVPLPICSCGVIPVSAAIRRHGAGKGPTTAFLISTPQTGVDSILVTYSLLGPVFAIYRPIAALISGLIGGMAVSAFDPEDNQADPPKEACTEACCTGVDTHGRLYRALAYGFGTIPRDIAGALLVGLLIAALASALVPADFFTKHMSGGVVQILLLMLLGIPIYMCATASIPIAAGLIMAGVSPGAAFALLVTGPATNAATISTVWKVLGRRTCLIYVGTMVMAAFFGGLLLNQLVTTKQVTDAMHHDWMPTWVKTVAAIALLGVLTYAIVTKRNSHTHEGDHSRPAPAI